MSRDEGESLYSSSDDDLIEVHVEPVARRTIRPNTLENLLNPRRSAGALSRPFSPASASAPGSNRASRRPENRFVFPPPPTPSSRQRSQAGQLQETAVIDLTEEPDSPVEIRPAAPQLQSQPQSQGSRNPRRTNSQRLSTPRLARSDGTLMRSEASFIDLTAEADDEPANLRRHNLRPQRPQRLPEPQHANDELFRLEILNAGHGLAADFANRFGQRLAGLGFLGADMFRAAGFRNQGVPMPGGRTFAARQPSPKPPMEPTPPTRDGFTRETRADSGEAMERVVVCPACDEELAYDPSDSVVHSSTTTGRGKRKRAAGDHHFWALKKCGHVSIHTQHVV